MPHLCDDRGDACERTFPLSTTSVTIVIIIIIMGLGFVSESDDVIGDLRDKRGCRLPRKLDGHWTESLDGRPYRPSRHTWVDNNAFDNVRFANNYG